MDGFGDRPSESLRDSIQNSMRSWIAIGAVGLLACGPDRDPDLDIHREDSGTGRAYPQATLMPLTTSGRIECADPTERQRLGPLFEAPLGESFGRQQPAVPEALVPSPGGGVAVADFTGDGRLDYFLPADSPCMLFVGQDDGTLADESIARIPLATTACLAWGASAGDLDGDGDLDLYVPRERAPDLLWENDGTGHFTDITEAAGIPDMECGSRSASWGDMDGDGDLDLFVARHRVILDVESDRCARPEPPDAWDIASGGPNLLLRNNGDRTFTDVSARLPYRGIHAFSFMGSWIDIDADGDLDLLIINDFGGRSTPNSTWLNNGSGHFRELDETSGLRLPIFGMGVSAADVNEDGRPDFAITDIERLHLMSSVRRLEWADEANARGLRPSTVDVQFASWGVALEDVDNSTLVDVVTVYGPTEDPLASADTRVLEQPDALFLQQDDGSFRDWGPEWGFDALGVGRGLVVADLDRNGWLDFVRPNYRTGPTTVHYQRCGWEAWLTVALDGPNHGYGARVELEVDGVQQTRWLDASNEGMASTGPPQVHFGLGAHEAVDMLRVIWPDGAVGYTRGVQTRQHVVVGHPHRAD